MQDAEFAQMNNEQEISNIQKNNNGENGSDEDDADQDEYDDQMGSGLDNHHYEQ